MGIYNTYGKVQLKVGELDMANYKIGDKVRISDGVYVGHDGIVVIIKGKFVAEFKNIVTTWGDSITPKKILEPYHPFGRVFKKIKKKNENKS